jgi:hypothetical protein
LSPFKAFLTQSAGDLLAARACADALLGGVPLPAGGVAARMVLSAACLHLHAQVGPEPGLEDVGRLLGGLLAQEPSAWAALRDCSIQFVQYAVVDLLDSRPELVKDALSEALRAVSAKLPVN